MSLANSTITLMTSNERLAGFAGIFAIGERFVLSHLIAIALVAGACSKSPLSKQERIEIDRAEERWNERRPASYTYEVRVICICPQEPGGWTEVKVVGDSVVSSKSLGPAAGGLEAQQKNSWWSVTRLFETVRTARKDDFYSVTASYDDQFGFPTHVAYRCHPDFRDCGTVVEARNLKAVP